MTTRVNQGKAEKTTRPVVQKDLVHVPERVRDPGMERFMDSGHGLEGGSTPRGVGWPPRGLLKTQLGFVFGALYWQPRKKTGMIGWGILDRVLRRSGLRLILAG